MQGERIEHYETQRVCKDGTRIDVSLTISPIRDSTGRIIGASKIARNITDRKRAEAALQQAHDALEQRVQDRTALLALMHDIAVAANTAPSPTVALQEALDRICTYTGWPVGHAYLPASDNAGSWVPTPIWHLADPGRFAAFQQATQTLQAASGEGLIGRVGATGTPVWGMEVATDPAYLRRAAAGHGGLTTGFAFPLLIGQEVVGVLEFYAAERRHQSQRCVMPCCRLVSSSAGPLNASALASRCSASRRRCSSVRSWQRWDHCWPVWPMS